MESTLSTSKKQEIRRAVETGAGLITVNPWYPGVALPEYLMKDPVVSLDLHPKKELIDWQPEELFVYLTFRSVEFPVIIPYESVVFIAGKPTVNLQLVHSDPTAPEDKSTASLKLVENVVIESTD